MICLDDSGHAASLQRGKVYKVIRPLPGDQPYDLRLIDEEGEDYLYPSRRFAVVELPPRARRAVSARSSKAEV